MATEQSASGSHSSVLITPRRSLTHSLTHPPDHTASLLDCGHEGKVGERERWLDGVRGVDGVWDRERERGMKEEKDGGRNGWSERGMKLK